MGYAGTCPCAAQQGMLIFPNGTREHWSEGGAGFSPGTLVFPSPQKTDISKFQFNQKSGKRRTTMWMCYLQIVIYLFGSQIHLLFF